jgi:hypothetical protein
MSRKDYVAVAEVLNTQAVKAVEGHEVTAFFAVADIANGLADLFAADNPRFDRDRFLTAAGVE